MSVLGRLLPFWVLGILAGWNSPSMELLLPAAILLSLVAGFCVKQFFPTSASHGIPVISIPIIIISFLSSFLISISKCPDSGLSDDKQVELIGRVVKVWPGAVSGRIKIKVLKYRVDDQIMPSREIMVLLTSKSVSEMPVPGDIILTETIPGMIEKRQQKGDFPERLFWAGEGVRKKGWINHWKPLEYRERAMFTPSAHAATVQAKLAARLDECPILPDRASIIKAMLLGKKDDLPEDIRSIFRKTGISHLLAVSGLHVGLVYLLVIRVFFFMKIMRAGYIAEILAVLAVWLYSYLTGFGPSVQRAAGMISLFALSRILGRRTSPLQVLIVAFYLQTALDPFSLFRFGFQLSYLAVAGILVFYKPWTRLAPVSNKLVKKLWNFSGVSVSAQSFTIPFILIYFKEFPLYFILGNLLLVPAGLLIFYLGALYLIVLLTGLDFAPMARIIDFLLGLMVWMGESIAALPFSMIDFTDFSLKHMLLYFVIMAIWFTHNKAGYFGKVKNSVLALIVFNASALCQYLL